MNIYINKNQMFFFLCLFKQLKAYITCIRLKHWNIYYIFCIKTPPKLSKINFSQAVVQKTLTFWNVAQKTLTFRFDLKKTLTKKCTDGRSEYEWIFIQNVSETKMSPLNISCWNYEKLRSFGRQPGQKFFFDSFRGVFMQNIYKYFSV